MQLGRSLRQGQRALAAVAVLAHQIGDGRAENLMHLLVPVEGIAQIDHAVEKHHVRTGIHAALAHHQILFTQLSDQGTLRIHHRKTTDVVITDQLDGVLQRRVCRDTQHGLRHHISDSQLQNHVTSSTRFILVGLIVLGCCSGHQLFDRSEPTLPSSQR